MFSRLILALVALALAFVENVQATDGPKTMRIIGGSETPHGQFPWMGSMHPASNKAFNRPGGHFCAAILIDKNLAVTAAHCVEKYKDAPATLGLTFGRTNLTIENSGVTVTASQIILHPNYKKASLESDVAVVKFTSPVNLEAAQLLRASDNVVSLTSGVLVGWGVTTTQVASNLSFVDTLQQATAPIPSESTCVSTMGPYFFPSSMLCAGKLASSSGASDGVDTCLGDSGGPLLATTSDGSVRLVGIASWGYECASNLYYGVYAKISDKQDWIKSFQVTEVGNPHALGLPTITGSPVVGNTLQCNNPSWEGQQLSFQYSWESSSGQTLGSGSSYTVNQANVGTTIRCSILARTALSATAQTSVSSGYTQAVTTGGPTGGNPKDKRRPTLQKIKRSCLGPSCTLAFRPIDTGRYASGVYSVDISAEWQKKVCVRVERKRVCHLDTKPVPLSAPAHDGDRLVYSFQLPETGYVRFAIVIVDNSNNIRTKTYKPRIVLRIPKVVP